MKVIALIAILSLVSISNCADAAKCNTWKCASGVTVPEGSCVKKVAVDGKKVGHISLQCKAPQVCPLASAADPNQDETKCAEPAKPEPLKDRLDGEACSDTVKCLDTLPCTNNKCVGRAKDAECNSPAQCAVGLSCLAGKCAAQIADDKTECTMDFDCANNLTCVSKKCVAYGSQELGTTVQSQLACKSGEVTDNKCSQTTLQGSNWKCSDAGQTKCKYTVKTDVETKDKEYDCVCSLSNASTQYCPADTSKNNVKFSPVTGVQTVRRFDGVVANGVAWPALEEADSCLRQLLNASYIKSALAIIAALVVLL